MGFWIVWLILGACFAVLYSVLLFPRILMRAYGATVPVRDRLIGRASDDNRAILVYEPALSARRYLKSYRIWREPDGMFFQADLGTRVALLRYEILVYNASNEIIEVIGVKETFNNELMTHVTALPRGADYVSVRLICVDDTPFPRERRPFNGKFAAWLCVLGGSLAATVDLLVWLGVTFTLRCLDGFTSVYSLPFWDWFVLLGSTTIVVVLLTVAVAVVRFFFVRRRGSSYGS